MDADVKRSRVASIEKTPSEAVSTRARRPPSLRTVKALPAAKPSSSKPRSPEPDVAFCTVSDTSRRSQIEPPATCLRTAPSGLPAGQAPRLRPRAGRAHFVGPNAQRLLFAAFHAHDVRRPVRQAHRERLLQAFEAGDGDGEGGVLAGEKVGQGGREPHGDVAIRAGGDHLASLAHLDRRRRGGLLGERMTSWRGDWRRQGP